MDVQDIVRESIDRLCRVINQLGNGAQRAVQRSFEIESDGQISRLLKLWRKKPQDLDLRLTRYVEICQALGVSPASILKFPGEPVMTAALPAIRKKDRQLSPSASDGSAAASAPSLNPVSSHTSRIALPSRAAGEGAIWVTGCNASLASVIDSIGRAIGTCASSGSTAPPGKTNFEGMKAAFAPRCPIKIAGSRAASRTRITVAASRMADLSITVRAPSRGEASGWVSKPVQPPRPLIADHGPF